MATTSPDNIRTPDPSDPYNLVADMATLAGDVQGALVKRGNMYVGTSAQRTAFTTAPEGVHWQDTNSDKVEWVRRGGSWAPATGVTSATLSISGATANYSPTVYRQGDFVWLDGAVSSLSSTNSTYVAVTTLPAGFRPVKYQYYSVSIPLFSVPCGLRVNTSGVVEVAVSSAVGSAVIPLSAVSFLAGD